MYRRLLVIARRNVKGINACPSERVKQPATDGECIAAAERRLAGTPGFEVRSAELHPEITNECFGEDIMLCVRVHWDEANKIVVLKNLQLAIEFRMVFVIVKKLLAPRP